jgi:hypothetical protein
MTQSECPPRCTAFGGNAGRKCSESTIGLDGEMFSANPRVLSSSMVRHDADRCHIMAALAIPGVLTVLDVER